MLIYVLAYKGQPVRADYSWTRLADGILPDDRLADYEFHQFYLKPLDLFPDEKPPDNEPHLPLSLRNQPTVLAEYLGRTLELPLDR